MRHNIIYILISAVLVGMIACTPAGGEKRGHEFMPDMVHSTAYEANIYEYYYYNKWGTEEEYKHYAMPRTSVPGTVARGEIGVALEGTPEERLMAYHAFMTGGAQNSIKVTPNGAVPYPYKDNDADRTRASNELLQNPFPITAAGLARGQVLYNTYCGICHGEKGDGAGYLVREADPAKGIVAGVYPAAPANFLKENFLDTTNGFFYHAIMYGKNMMGPYADKLSYEERWQVIHYIRSLQAKQLKLVYNENENTYTSDVPGGPMLAKLNIPATHPVLGPEAMPGDTSHVAPVDTTHSGVHGVGEKGNGEH